MRSLGDYPSRDRIFGRKCQDSEGWSMWFSFRPCCLQPRNPHRSIQPNIWSRTLISVSLIPAQGGLEFPVWLERRPKAKKLCLLPPWHFLDFHVFQITDNLIKDVTRGAQKDLIWSYLTSNLISSFNFPRPRNFKNFMVLQSWVHFNFSHFDCSRRQKSQKNNLHFAARYIEY